MCKEYEVKKKMVQQQWLQLKMNDFIGLLNENFSIVRIELTFSWETKIYKCYIHTYI